MKIEKKYLEFWKQNLDHGDKQILATECGVTPPTITAAFEGEATAEVITKINAFFIEKKKRVSESFSKS